MAFSIADLLSRLLHLLLRERRRLHALCPAWALCPVWARRPYSSLTQEFGHVISSLPVFANPARDRALSNRHLSHWIIISPAGLSSLPASLQQRSEGVCAHSTWWMAAPWALVYQWRRCALPRRGRPPIPLCTSTTWACWPHQRLPPSSLLDPLDVSSVQPQLRGA